MQDKSKTIPSDWKVVRLIDIAKPIKDTVGDRKLETLSISAGIGFVNQANKFGKELSGKQYVHYTVIQRGDFSFNKGNSRRYPYGCIYKLRDRDIAAVPNAFYSFRIEGQCTDYFEELFKSGYLNSQLKRLINTGVRDDGLFNLYEEDFYNCTVLMPTLDEQKKIAEILMMQDNVIALKEKLLEKKKIQKKWLMQNLLTGKIRLAGFKEEWTSFKLGDNCEVVTGATPSTENKLYWGGSILWMSSGELNKKIIYSIDGRITPDGFKAASLKMLPLKCVLIGLAGQGKTRGTVAINYIEICTNQSVAAVLPSKTFVPEFLYYNLDSRYEELRMLSSSGDGTRGGLNIPLIKSINVIAPTYEEQLKIAERLTAADKEIELLTKDIESQKSLKQYLMQQLLTGKIRV